MNSTLDNKILFIGDGYPVGKNAGAILYTQVIKTYGVEKFCYYGVGAKYKGKIPQNLQDLPKMQSSLRIFPRNKYYKILKRIPLVEELFYYIKVPFVERKVIKFLKRNDVNLIICVLRADVLAIINRVIKKTNIPLLGYISDTVEAEFSEKRLIYNLKLKEYFKAINTSKSIYVAGETMQKYIQSSFQKKTSILRLGFEDNLISERALGDSINIFFSGSVYAQQEFETFVNALNEFAFKFPQFTIKLMTATKYNIKTQTENVEIENLGWQKEENLYKIMKECHIGYLPYKFDLRNKMQMQYAFPTKSGFYLSSGLPIFFHGPEYSSMVEFFKKYECGIHCASLQTEKIIRHLGKIIFDKEFYSKCLRNAEIAYKNEFTIEVMKNNFKELVDFALNN